MTLCYKQGITSHNLQTQTNISTKTYNTNCTLHLTRSYTIKIKFYWDNLTFHLILVYLIKIKNDL